MYIVRFNIYARTFSSAKAARAFARAIRAGGCIVHGIEKVVA